MKTSFDISYIDRQSGKVMKEEIYGSHFLMWAYNSLVGSWMLNIIFKRRFFSWLYGWLHKQPYSSRKISRFIVAMKVDLEECVIPSAGFGSFNDFFTREIDLSKRKIVADPNVCIAASDGKILAYQHIDADKNFIIKRHLLNIPKLLGDDFLAEEYDGGSLVISRIALTDYHHFHFPVSGVPKESEAINGVYHASGPYALSKLVSFYSGNYRMLTAIDTKNFGRVIMVEIGALTVGSIHQSFVAGKQVKKGDKKGYFELGGSTVVLLFHKNAIQLDRDLISNTSAGNETYVKFGESIGRCQ